MAHLNRVMDAAGQPSVIEDVRELPSELWEYRGLARELALRDIRIRYKQSLMGVGWALLMPALVVAAGTLVRQAMAYLAGTSLDAETVAGVAVKAVPWAFFAGAIGFGTSSLTANAQLITKIYFPRALLPVATTLAQAFDSLVASAAVLLLVAALGIPLTPAALWAPLMALLLVIFTTGLALLLACANLFFRDVKYLVQTFLMFGIFVTPVFIEPAMFGPEGSRLMMLNPLAPMLEGIRLSLVEGHNLLTPLVQGAGSEQVVLWLPWYLAYAAGWSLLCLLGGAVLFRVAEFRFAEYV